MSLRRHSYLSGGGWGTAGVVGVIAIAVILLAVAYGGYQAVYKGTETTVNHALVTDKDRVCDSTTSSGSQTCRYLIFTDKGTFEITDIPFQRTNSSDVYGQIRENRTYNFQVMGWRNEWSSTYQNILSYTEVPS